VEVAAHLRFSVDGNHPFPADTDSCSDAVGLAEHVVTRHENRETVYLPHLVAIRFDPENILLDQFLDPFLDQV